MDIKVNDVQIPPFELLNTGFNLPKQKPAYQELVPQPKK